MLSNLKSKGGLYAATATLAFGSPAGAVIGTPTYVGSANTTSASSLSVSSVTAGAGTLLVVGVGSNTTAPTPTISDSGGNTWSSTALASNGGQGVYTKLFFAIVTNSLSGGTITVSGLANFRSSSMLVASVSGVTGIDAGSANTGVGAGNGNAPFPTSTPSSLSQPVEIIFGAENQLSHLSNLPAGWINIHAGTSVDLRLDYETVNNNSQVTYAPTNGTGAYDGYSGVIQGFLGPYTAPPNPHGLTTVGVGE